MWTARLSQGTNLLADPSIHLTELLLHGPKGGAAKLSAILQTGGRSASEHACADSPCSSANRSAWSRTCGTGWTRSVQSRARTPSRGSASNRRGRWRRNHGRGRRALRSGRRTPRIRVGVPETISDGILGVLAEVLAHPANPHAESSRTRWHISRTLPTLTMIEEIPTTSYWFAVSSRTRMPPGSGSRATRRARRCSPGSS